MGKLSYNLIEKKDNIEKFTTTFPLSVPSIPIEAGYLYSSGKDSAGNKYINRELSNIVSVKTSFFYSIALDNQGKVHIWGEDLSELEDLYKLPTDLNNVVAVELTRWAAMALLSDGTVRTWGYFNYANNNTFIVPDILKNKTVVAISASQGILSAGAMYALINDGTVVSWGPDAILMDPTINKNIISINAGSNYVLLNISGNYLIAKLTSNKFIDLSNKNVINAKIVSDIIILIFNDGTFEFYDNNGEKITTMPITQKIKDVCGQFNIIYGITDDNKLIEIYNNGLIISPIISQIFHTMIGDASHMISTNIISGSNSYASYTIVISKIPYPPPVTTPVTTPVAPTTPVTTTARYVFPLQVPTLSNIVGSIGYVENIDSYDSTLFSNDIVSVCCNRFTICAIRKNGTIVSQGIVDLNNITDAVQVECNSTFAFMILKKDGTIISKGYNTSNLDNIPSMLNSNGHKVVSISISDTHVLALRDDGKVFTWGYDNNVTPPVPDNLNNIVAISAGDKYSLALDKDGIVHAWGEDNNGRLNVTAYSDIAAISAGKFCSLLLTNNGDVIVVATNDKYNIKNIPLTVKNVISIQASTFCMTVLKSDGTIIRWGDISDNSLSNIKNVLSIYSRNGFSLAAIVSNPPIKSDDSNNKLKIGLGVGLGLLGLLLIVGVLIYIFKFRKSRS